jgi:hypothetical protein
VGFVLEKVVLDRFSSEFSGLLGFIMPAINITLSLSVIKIG